MPFGQPTRRPAERIVERPDCASAVVRGSHPAGGVREAERVPPLRVIPLLTLGTAARDREEAPGEILCDRARPPVADEHAIELYHRRDLGRSPHHEDLFRATKVVHVVESLAHLVSRPLRDGDDRVPGLALEDVRFPGRHEDRAAPRPADVHPRALGHVPVLVEHHSVVVATRLGAALDHGADVVAPDALGLAQLTGQGGPEELGLEPEPSAGPVAEVLAPGPRDDCDLQRIAECAESHVSVPDENDRPNVTTVQQVLRVDDVEARPLDVIGGVRDFDPEDARALEEPREMVVQPEDVVVLADRPLAEPDPFEHAVAVVQGERQDPLRRLARRNDLSVQPDVVDFDLVCHHFSP